MSDNADWRQIEADYLSGEMSVQDIARKHGVSASTLYKKATSQGWKKKKDKIAQKADEIVIARRARARAAEFETMCSATSRLANLLDKTVAALEDQPPEMVCKQLKGLSALGSAMKSNVDALMLLHGVQTKAQAEAQKIARARLKLEKRKQEWAEGKDAAGTGAQQVEVTIKREVEEYDEQIEHIKRICTDPNAEA